jgi:hypothetical protein
VDELRRIVERNKPAPPPADRRPHNAPSAFMVGELRERLRADARRGRNDFTALQQDAQEMAYHEAAHAVAHFLGGDGVREVSLTTRYRPGRQSAVKPEMEVTGGYCLTRRTFRSVPACLVGVVAQARVRPCAWGAFTISRGSKDYDDAIRLLRDSGRSAADLPTEQRKAEAFVDENWKAIRAVAERLMEEVCLDGDEAERIITTALGIRRQVA